MTRKISIDEDPANADWTKKTWDVHHATKPEHVKELKGTPAYKYAERGVPGKKDKKEKDT